MRLDVLLPIAGSMICGVLFASAALIGAVLAMHSFVPRVDESIRRIADIPWSWFVTIPFGVAGTSTLAAGTLLPRPIRPLAFWVGGGLTLFVLVDPMTDLLRRSFIGKF